MQFINKIYAETRETVEFYSDGWKTRHNKLGNSIERGFSASYSLAASVPKASLTTDLKISHIESEACASRYFEYQFDVVSYRYVTIGWFNYGDRLMLVRFEDVLVHY